MHMPTWRKQFDVPGDIRDKLREGKPFDIVINELEEEMKISTILRVRWARIKIPDENDLRHKRACSRERISGKELVLGVHLDWLDKEAKRAG